MLLSNLAALLTAAALLLSPGGTVAHGGWGTVERAAAAPPVPTWVLPSRLPEVGAGGMQGK